MYETTQDILMFSRDNKNTLVETQIKRLMAYNILLCDRNDIDSKHQKVSPFTKVICAIGSFWNRESRHPLMGILICTILGGIFISLVAGIILEAMILTVN